MGRFKENEISKFLELYKISECLWKCHHKYYRIKSKRNEAYVRIRDAMNLSSILEVKQKIKSFRDTYASERAKVRKSMMIARNPGEVYKPKLRWYDLADSFLNNPEGNTKTDFRLAVDDTQTGNTFNTPNTANVQFSEPEAVYPNLEAPPAYGMISNHQVVHQQPQVHASEHHQQFRPPHQERPIYFRQPARNSVCYPMERYDRNFPHQKGEFYHFGMNIAMQLSSLPLVQALNVQTKIQQMLCEERIAHEQGRYENFYEHDQPQFETPAASNFVAEKPQTVFQEQSASLTSSPTEEDEIKEEFFVEEETEAIVTGAGF